MGNPHVVTIVDNVSDFDVKKYGSILEINEVFPNKTNVEFVEIKDPENIKMRVWKGGAGRNISVWYRCLCKRCCM